MSSASDELPAELQQDTLILEEPLPTREELAKIVTDTFATLLQQERVRSMQERCDSEGHQGRDDAFIGLPRFLLTKHLRCAWTKRKASSTSRHSGLARETSSLRTLGCPTTTELRR
jgi:hypothetical protein